MVNQKGTRNTLQIVCLLCGIVISGGIAASQSFAEEVSLTHGPLLGAVKATSAKVWVRTSMPALVEVEYSTSPDFLNSVLSAGVMTDQKSDMTGTMRLTNLSPEALYFYRLRTNGVTLPGTYQFISSPETSRVRTFSFAVLSDFQKAVAPAYASVASQGPAFVIFLGDFSHAEPATLSEMRAMHRQMRGSESAAGRDFIKHIMQFPFYHVWDDHDFGKNNADKTFSGKQDALKAFREYFPTTVLPSANGIWHKFQYAQAEFFLLDLRSQRDPNSTSDGPNKSILGPEQKEWLKNALLSSTAQWKFIMSTVPFNPSSKIEDSWGAFQTERHEIVDFIQQNGIEGVIIISGDLHTGGALDDGTNSSFPELSVPHANIPSCTTPTSCKCNTAKTSPGIWSEGILCGIDNPGYGFITVQSDMVILQVFGSDGTERFILNVQ
jgi:alkaline phosphatase D